MWYEQCLKIPQSTNFLENARLSNTNKSLKTDSIEIKINRKLHIKKSSLNKITKTVSITKIAKSEKMKQKSSFRPPTPKDFLGEKGGG